MKEHDEGSSAFIDESLKLEGERIEDVKRARDAFIDESLKLEAYLREHFPAEEEQDGTAVDAAIRVMDRVKLLEGALRGMLEHCECQGRGYRSWFDMQIVKRCNSMTCDVARELLGVELPTSAIERIKQIDEEYKRSYERVMRERDEP